MYRNQLKRQWTDYNENNVTMDWFGEGSMIDNVSITDINETIQYLGAKRYYHVEERDERASLIAAVVLACIVGATMLCLVFGCTKN